MKPKFEESSLGAISELIVNFLRLRLIFKSLNAIENALIVLA